MENINKYNIIRNKKFINIYIFNIESFPIVTLMFQ